MSAMGSNANVSVDVVTQKPPDTMIALARAQGLCFVDEETAEKILGLIERSLPSFSEEEIERVAVDLMDYVLITKNTKHKERAMQTVLWLLQNNESLCPIIVPHLGRFPASQDVYDVLVSLATNENASLSVRVEAIRALTNYELSIATLMSLIASDRKEIWQEVCYGQLGVRRRISPLVTRALLCLLRPRKDYEFVEEILWWLAEHVEYYTQSQDAPTLVGEIIEAAEEAVARCPTSLSFVCLARMFKSIGNLTGATELLSEALDNSTNGRGVATIASELIPLVFEPETYEKAMELLNKLPEREEMAARTAAVSASGAIIERALKTRPENADEIIQRCLAILVRLLSGAETLVQRDAFYTLCQFPQLNGVLSTLMDTLMQWREHPWAFDVSVRNFARIPKDYIVPFLRERVRASQTKEERLVIARILSEIPDNKFAEALFGLASNLNEDARMTIIETLINLFCTENDAQ